MQKEEITAIFDKQASNYDEQWSKMAPINGALHLLTAAVLSGLPTGARILCVGAGTGTEILHLAERFPDWRFTAVEPSSAMMDVLRRRAEESGISHRCTYHAGYLEALPPDEPFDAATAFLVSHFILDEDARTGFFKSISTRLAPRGILVASDLSADLGSSEGKDLLTTWFRLMAANGIPPEGLENMRGAYERDVGILPFDRLTEMISRAGLNSPVRFFQAGMIQAWYARNAIE